MTGHHLNLSAQAAMAAAIQIAAAMIHYDYLSLI